MRPATAIPLLLRLILGLLLAVAGVLKLRDPTAFATEIANYQLFPALAPVLAAILPLVEIVIGARLIVLPHAGRRAAAAAALALFVMFTGAVSSGLLPAHQHRLRVLRHRRRPHRRADAAA